MAGFLDFWSRGHEERKENPIAVQSVPLGCSGPLDSTLVWTIKSSKVGMGKPLRVAGL